MGRTIRVDHCEQYRAPNADMSKVDEVTAAIRMEGCAPQLQPLITRTETVVKQVSTVSALYYLTTIRYMIEYGKVAHVMQTID